MLSRLVDIPLGALQWVLSWIVLICVVYTYVINKLTRAHPAHPHVVALSALPPIPSPTKSRTHAYLTHLHIHRLTTQKLIARRHLLSSSAPFRLLALPPEISALILEHTAAWPETYIALMQTSSRTRRLAMGACLPRMGVCLVGEGALRSFRVMLGPGAGVNGCGGGRTENVAGLIRHLWITPLHADLLPLAVSILARCTRLRTLATNLHVLHAGVSVHPVSRVLSHAELGDLCVMKARREAWTGWVESGSGRAVLGRVGRLRLIGGGAEEFVLVDGGGGLHLPRLTGISFGTSGSGGTHVHEGVRRGTRSALTMLEDTTRFPRLRTVLVTCGRGSTGGLRVSRPVVGKRVWVVELPGSQTELEMWCDNAHGRGLWALCD